MINNISINCHSSIKINGEKVIYIDPYKIKEVNKDADLIFITHEHYDYYSSEDINKIKKSSEDRVTRTPSLLIWSQTRYQLRHVPSSTIPLIYGHYVSSFIASIIPISPSSSKGFLFGYLWIYKY